MRKRVLRVLRGVGQTLGHGTRNAIFRMHAVIALHVPRPGLLTGSRNVKIGARTTLGHGTRNAQ